MNLSTRRKATALLSMLALILTNTPVYAGTPPTTLNIDVVAAGDSFQGAPILYLRLNGSTVKSFSITNGKDNWKTYSASVARPTNFNNISVAFWNDYYVAAGKDRNLYVQSIKVNGVTLTPAQATTMWDSNGKPTTITGDMGKNSELSWSVWSYKSLVDMLAGNTVTATTAATTTSTVSTSTGNVPISAPTPDKTISDNQGYSKGPLQVYLAPWGKGNLVAGKDFSDTASIVTSTFPNNTTIKWNWPSTASKAVYNFNAIDYGNYDYNVTPPLITPQQVKKITTLTETHDFSLSGEVANYDVIDDIFLTSKSNDVNYKLFEIEVMYHAPSFAISYAQSVTQLGQIKFSGITWNVSLDRNAGLAPDILIYPASKENLLSGTYDLQAMFQQLITIKALTGNEWFNGYAFGQETKQGSGALTINSFSINYK